ncbi:MAG: Gfo/Idh/MocA family oxidoreductase [Verrucomicrobiota bacterium]
MAKKPLRVGLIGAGGVVRGFHLNPGWTELGNAVELVAVADVYEPNAKKLAEDFGIGKVYTDFRRMLRESDLDAVDICAPNRVHTPAVVAALQKGCHVLCEKPLAVTTAEVRKMAAAAKKAKKILMTAQHQRWTQSAQTAKAWIDAGRLGEVYHSVVHALRRNWVPPRPGFIDVNLSGGGPSMDIGVHALDLGMHLMGFPKPVRVTGKYATNFAKGHDLPGGWGEWDRKLYTVEDFASGFVHFDNGATMVLESSWLNHQEMKEDLSVRLYGKKAMLHWPENRFATSDAGVLVDGELSPAGDRATRAHTAEILAFHEAIVEGRKSPVPVQETLYVIAILEAIEKSGRLGREIRLKL